MKRSISGLLLAAASAVACAAPLTLWGTEAGGSAAACPSLDCSFRAVDIQTLQQNLPQQDGAVVALSAAARVAHPGVDFQARATLGGGLDLPQLQVLAAADSAAGYSVAARAGAIQAYAYSGTGPTTYTLDIGIDGDLFGNASLSGFVVVWDATRPRPLLGQFLGTPITGTRFVWQGVEGDQPAPLTFTLEEGAEIYIQARFFALASSPPASVADAYHTLPLSSRDAQGLEVAGDPAMPAPEPARAGLVALALLAAPRRRGRGSAVPRVS
ncbi:MAG: hypothetical protein U1F56_23355 [Rubrivivax sp.]